MSHLTPDELAGMNDDTSALQGVFGLMSAPDWVIDETLQIAAPLLASLYPLPPGGNWRLRLVVPHPRHQFGPFRGLQLTLHDDFGQEVGGHTVGWMWCAPDVHLDPGWKRMRNECPARLGLMILHIISMERARENNERADRVRRWGPA